jgi:serine/threonine-protein kinase
VANHRVRRIDTDGRIDTIAGTGVPGYAGDEGRAVDAQLQTPYGLLVDGEDALLVADSGNHVIRRIGADGLIRTVAGSGERGYSGDGGPALSARFDSPQSLARDEAGRWYIGDEHNHAIRVVDGNGAVRTLIGRRGPGFSGDGGPAGEAQIADPENLWIRPDGSILIAVQDNSRLRLITPDGLIRTFAGKGPTRAHRYTSPIRLAPVDLWREDRR